MLELIIAIIFSSMKISAWNNGQNTYGLRIGKQNREIFFSPKWKFIEVEIDEKFHRFELTDSFWKNCPEFRDKGKPILRDLLSQHDLLNWAFGKPPEFDHVPLGGGKFRLEL